MQRSSRFVKRVRKDPVPLDRGSGRRRGQERGHPGLEQLLRGHGPGSALRERRGEDERQTEDAEGIRVVIFSVMSS